MNGTDSSKTEDQELCVVMGAIPRIEQIPDLASERPVDVLARAVHPGEGLLVQQAGHAVFRGDPLELLHDDMLVIVPQIRALVDRRDLELAWRDFIVAGLDRDALFVELVLGFHHESQHPLGDRAEVVVFEFLTFRRLGPEERPPGIEEVGAGEEEISVDQEIFLLGTRRCADHAGVFVAENLEDTLGLYVERLHGTQQWCLVVERFAGPGNKRGRDTESVTVGVFVNVGRTGDIPGRVAARLKGRADAARGKTRRVRLGLDQCAAGELRDGAAGPVGIEEAVVFLCGQAGQREEDVREMGGSLFERPGHHGRSHDIGDCRIEFLPALDRLLQRFIDGLGKQFAHHLVVEDVGAVQRSGRFAFQIDGVDERFVIDDRGDGFLPSGC
jgi:hypothetical protein